MTTLIINSNSAEAVSFLQHARSLPFVEVIEKSDEPVVRFKPAVERSMRRSLKGKGLVACQDADDMFQKLGI